MLNILVVDDEQIVRVYLQSIVNWEGYGCQIIDTCKNGLEALNFLKTYPVDLVLTDLKMPKMNGLELIEEMRANHLDIPVIVLSNHSDYDLVRQALKLGAIDYLVKMNLEIQDLLDLIKQVKQEISNKESSEQRFKKEEQEALETFKLGRKSFLATILKGDLYYSEEELDQYMKMYRLTERNFSLYRLRVKENNEIHPEQFSYLDAIINEQFGDLDFDIIHFNQQKVLVVLYEYEHLEEPVLMDRWLKMMKQLQQYLNLEIQISKGLVIDSAHKLISCTKLFKESQPLHPENPIISNQELANYRPEIQLVLQYIHEHYVNRITLQDLAAHACLNESYLSRLFKVETKKTLNSYLNELRIYKAKQLLTQSDIRVKEVAQLVGIKDQLYFNRVFKKFCGENPTEYQERVKKVYF